MNGYSIVSRSYLSHLRTMFDSLSNQHPELILHILMIDDLGPYQNDFSNDRVQFYRPEQFLSNQDMFALYSQNSPFEVSCILKSKFARYLFEQNLFETLIYLDSDLFFVNPIYDFLACLKKSAITLLPHKVIANENPSNSQIRQEASCFAAGIFNMGFFGLKRCSTTERFLNWWDRRTSFHCRREITDGFYDDQAWIDAVPSLFDDITIFKNPGYNVANWNLDERSLTFENEQFFVNSQRLVFFHFSRCDLNQDEHLTEHLPIRLDEHPPLNLLFQRYKQQMLKNDYLESWARPFSKILKIIE